MTDPGVDVLRLIGDTAIARVGGFESMAEKAVVVAASSTEGACLPAILRVAGGLARIALEEEDVPLPLLEDRDLPIAAIYVPAKRRRTLDEATVAALAESILEEGMKAPILVREDGARYVLVEGLHRLEACKALGEETVNCTLVQARGS